MVMSTLKIDMDIGVDERPPGRSQEEAHLRVRRVRQRRRRSFGRKVEFHLHHHRRRQQCRRALRHSPWRRHQALCRCRHRHHTQVDKDELETRVGWRDQDPMMGEARSGDRGE